MFEAFFTTALLTFTTDRQLVERLWAEINTQYTGRGRYYHNVTHLDNLVATLAPIRHLIADWQTIMFSIAYHDIIYDSSRNDNEEKSAAFACERLSALHIHSGQKDKCYHQIMATKGHQLSTETDTNYFTDADLAILGSAPAQYNAYAVMVRKEYRQYPDLLYKPGRRKVLKHFLQMPSIYKTAFFKEQYEQQAKENLAAELKMLSS